MRDMEVVMEWISNWRIRASQIRQMKIFDAYADWLLENAKGAEKWLVKASKAYPKRCDSNGKPIGGKS